MICFVGSLTDWFVFFREEPCLRVTHSLLLWGLLVKVRISFHSFWLPIVTLLLWLVFHGAVWVWVARQRSKLVPFNSEMRQSITADQT